MSSKFGFHRVSISSDEKYSKNVAASWFNVSSTDCQSLAKEVIAK